jgi:hypothetical protein
MSEQRKSNWQHPNTYYRDREETPDTDECDASRHPHPYRTLPTKSVQIMADRPRDVVLETVHFLVEIGNPRQLAHPFVPRVRPAFSAPRISRSGRSPLGCLGFLLLPASSRLANVVPPTGPRPPINP